MGPTWGRPGPCRPQMGPMLVQWTLLSQNVCSGEALPYVRNCHVIICIKNGFKLVPPCCEPEECIIFPELWWNWNFMTLLFHRFSQDFHPRLPLVPIGIVAWGKDGWMELSVCPSVCLSICLLVSPSVHPSICLPVCLKVRPKSAKYYSVQDIK